MLLKSGGRGREIGREEGRGRVRTGTCVCALLGLVCWGCRWVAWTEGGGEDGLVAPGLGGERDPQPHV